MVEYTFKLGLTELEKLAENIGAILKVGDVISLNGDLGTGKTTVARALIRSLLNEDDNTEIPSPTFALVQTYETRRFPIAHYDFYRLSSPDEVFELGLDEAVTEGLVILEWPEKIGGYLPEDRLDIDLSESEDSEKRIIVLRAAGQWSETLLRFINIQRFLNDCGWQSAQQRFLQGDASTRRYMRIIDNNGCKAVLMDAPKQADGPPIRNGKPYSKIAHLAEDVVPFYAVGQELRRLGFHAPDVYGHDFDNGLLLIEDLGDAVFGTQIAEGTDIYELYCRAVDVLIDLHRYSADKPLPITNGSNYELPTYDSEAMGIEVELLADWYWPVIKGSEMSEKDRHSFLDQWQIFFDIVEKNLSTMVLRDYHSPNLILIDGSKTGLIDYQDAQKGNPAYDLVSLLQDARLTVGVDIEAKLLDYYCKKCLHDDVTNSFVEDDLRRDYAILGAQRNTKLLGIFVRLAKRDGKRGYLAHLPRTWEYLERNLKHPELRDLRCWYDEHFPPDMRYNTLNI